MNKCYISISGFATVGKDLMCQILIDKLTERGYKSKRIALADALKADTRGLLLEKYGIDVLNCTGAEKEKIRPDLVAIGCQRRAESNNSYWTSKVDDIVKNWDVDFVIVPDVRFYETEQDEIPWIRSKPSHTMVYITRYTNINGQPVYIKAPNKKEEENDPKIKNAADFCIEWETMPTEQLLETYKHYFDEIINYAIHSLDNPLQSDQGES